MAYNPYIVVPLATWAIAQVAKFALAAMRGTIDFRYLYASGGMPSVHSAIVCSLATTAFFLGGPNSPVFGLTVVLAVIVMYDSFGVRRASGEQAVAINMLIDSLDRGKVKLEQPGMRLREMLGHQPLEVVVGALLGVILGGLFNYTHLNPVFNFLQVIPKGLELWIYGGIFVVILVAGFLQQFLLRARYRKSVTMQQLTRRILTASQTIGWLGLVTVVLQYEHASYLSWRLWALLILSIGAFWALVIGIVSFQTVPAALTKEAETARKRKWLIGSKRK